MKKKNTMRASKEYLEDILPTKDLQAIFGKNSSIYIHTGFIISMVNLAEDDKYKKLFTSMLSRYKDPKIVYNMIIEISISNALELDLEINDIRELAYIFLDFLKRRKIEDSKQAIKEILDKVLNGLTEILQAEISDEQSEKVS